MKKVFVFLLLIVSICINAQKYKPQNNPHYDFKWLHFGFTLGLNTMDFTIKHNAEQAIKDSLFPDITNLQPGFHVAMVSDLRLGTYFNLRFLPGIAFGQRDLNYLDQDGNTERVFHAPSTYLDFPLLVKYKAKRLNNFRPYLIAGFDIKYDMSSNKHFKDDEEYYIRLQPFSYFYEVGIGLDNYLPYFKFATELKVSIGLTDVFNHEPHEDFPQYTRVVDRMNSYMVSLSFHFE